MHTLRSSNGVVGDGCTAVSVLDDGDSAAYPHLVPPAIRLHAFVPMTLHI